MRSVRIYFSKTGDAKYISHLDLVRCFNRAVARAGIPIFFTEGFNPRPYMNFAMPLSLGVSGLREIVDMKIDGEMTNDEIYSALSSVMPPDIKILEVCEPVRKASAVAFSRYKLEICQESMPSEAFNSAVSEMISRPELLVSKTGKQGKRKVVKYINLTEHIKDFKSWSLDEKNSVITLVLPSNTQFGISPVLFTDKVFEELSVDPVFCLITRKAILDENFDELK
mgnify:FL=1